MDENILDENNHKNLVLFGHYHRIQHLRQQILHQLTTTSLQFSFEHTNKQEYTYSISKGSQSLEARLFFELVVSKYLKVSTIGFKTPFPHVGQIQRGIRFLRNGNLYSFLSIFIYA